MPQVEVVSSAVSGGASFVVAYRLAGRRVVVVGGGEVAASRVFFALEADGVVMLVCPADELVSGDLQARIARREIGHVARRLAKEDLDGAAMVLSATSDVEVGQDVAAWCNERRIPCNVADVPKLCDFWLMSQHRQGDLQIAVSTNGHGPKLANRIRQHVAASLPPRCDEAIRQISLLRQRVRQVDPAAAAMGKRMKWMSEASEAPLEWLAEMTEEQRDQLVQLYVDGQSSRVIWPSAPAAQQLSRPPWLRSSIASIVTFIAQALGLLSSPRASLPLLVAPTPSVAATADTPSLRDLSSGTASPVSEASETPIKSGRIVLVGAGPGDPELLTRKAYRYLQEADVVVADRLLPHAMLDLVKGELHIAKKYPGRANEAQDETNEIALQALLAGRFVVRLKCGDPFVYGRGGEEVLFFRKYGFEAEVVPGISSVFAAPAVASIAVTHRGAADQILVLTGHDRKNNLPSLPPYSAKRTCVFLMASDRLGDLKDVLVEQGFPADCPAAIVEKATWPEQRTFHGTISTLADIVVEHKVTSPATVIVGGSVASLVQ